MTTIKAYTDIEQSKKLTEILPQDSADMFYKYILPKSDKIHLIPEIGNPINSLKWYNEGYTFRGKKEPITLNEYCVPCWSLAALLNVLPTLDGRNATLCKDIRYDEWHIFYHSTATLSIIDTKRYENAIDACYEMILKLHEFELL